MYREPLDLNQIVGFDLLSLLENLSESLKEINPNFSIKYVSFLLR